MFGPKLDSVILRQCFSLQRYKVELPNLIENELGAVINCMFLSSGLGLRNRIFMYGGQKNKP